MRYLQYGLVFLVTLVWLVGYGLAFYTGSEQPTALNVLMGLVLGWVFGSSTLDAVKRLRIVRNGKEDSDG